MRHLLAASLLTLALPGQALAAHLDPAPATYNTTGQAVTVGIHTDGQSTSSGVAYKLSSESNWHRCLAHDVTVTLNLPAGDYSLEVADDTSRPYFDENFPDSTTPECSQTGKPNGPDITPTIAYFYVRDAPAPAVVAEKPVTVCDLDRGHIIAVTRDVAKARAAYRRRHTRARKRAYARARAELARASRTFRRDCDRRSFD